MTSITKDELRKVLVEHKNKFGVSATRWLRGLAVDDALLGPATIARVAERNYEWLITVARYDIVTGSTTRHVGPPAAPRAPKAFWMSNPAGVDPEKLMAEYHKAYPDVIDAWKTFVTTPIPAQRLIVPLLNGDRLMDRVGQEWSSKVKGGGTIAGLSTSVLTGNYIAGHVARKHRVDVLCQWDTHGRCVSVRPAPLVGGQWCKPANSRFDLVPYEAPEVTRYSNGRVVLSPARTGMTWPLGVPPDAVTKDGFALNTKFAVKNETDRPVVVNNVRLSYSSLLKPDTEKTAKGGYTATVNFTIDELIPFPRMKWENGGWAVYVSTPPQKPVEDLAAPGGFCYSTKTCSGHKITDQRWDANGYMTGTTVDELHRRVQCKWTHQGRCVSAKRNGANMLAPMRFDLKLVRNEARPRPDVKEAHQLLWEIREQSQSGTPEMIQRMLNCMFSFMKTLQK